MMPMCKYVLSFALLLVGLTLIYWGFHAFGLLCVVGAAYGLTMNFSDQ